MGAAKQGVTLLHGEFTPDSDISSYTIDPGREVSMILVQCKSNELISGVRNFSFFSCINYDGERFGYGQASNTTGTAWGSATYWSVSGQISVDEVIEKNGTAYTFKPQRYASNAKFYASRTYEWFAI